MDFKFGEDFEETLSKIEPEDLMVEMSGAPVIRIAMGSLLALKAQLKELLGEHLKFFTISSTPLYVVKWHDLTPRKQDDIRGKRNG